jgi:nucleotide-binding universal stress UspA family protein
MFSKILVGTDGSDTAARAVARAVDLAASIDAELVVVSAHGPGGQPRAQQIVDEVQKQQGGSVKLKGIAKEGHPADVLADVAEVEKADLIVVGNKGMTGAGRFLLGSVPNRVSHGAPTNVLIVRTT